MVRRMFLHIGAPKTGTTALQTRLQRNAAALLEHGVLVPMGERGNPRARPAGLALRAALDLTGHVLGQDPAEVAGSWPRLIAQVLAHAGTAVVSHEGFVRCDEHAVARIMSDLDAGGGGSTELHVVYTARDLGRQLVSGWLEGLKHGGTDELRTHLDRARSGDLPLRSSFDVPAVLGRWRTHLPPERLHLVTVPPPGGDRSLLWRRFADLVGLDDDWAPKDPPRTNESVGIPEAQVLLALNRALGGSNARGREHHRLVRRTVVAQGLVGREGDRVEVPPADAAWTGAEVEAWIAWVEESGVDVVGDLDELRTADRTAGAWVDPAVPHPAVAEAAAAALAAVIVEAHRLEG